MGVLKWKVSNLINLLFPEYLVNECFMSSHWLRSVCQFSLSHGRVWQFSRSPSRFKTFMSESIAQFKRSDNQSRNLNWKIISVKEWKCSGNSWLFVWWLFLPMDWMTCLFYFSFFFMILMPWISIAVVFKCVKLWYRWCVINKITYIFCIC
jgi:hypothetical protein